MNSRVIISVLLVSLGFILAFLPSPDKPSLIVKPQKVWNGVNNPQAAFTPDQVAKFVVIEDSSVQLIDLRPAAEYTKFNIPGAVNLPYADLVTHPEKLNNILNRSFTKNIFYSNGNMESAYAMVIAEGMGYKNVFTLNDGLNGWFRDVMNSEFKGTVITARENALFEVRTRARRLFTEINSLPDSAKANFMKLKNSEAKKLDGGCE